MKYYTYVIDDEYIDGRAIQWKMTGNGEYVIGEADGSKYFIKRNIHVRYPDKSLPESIFKKYYAEAKVLEDKQEKLKKLMAGLDFDTDHIVVEEENFWDKEKMFVTVTRLVEDALSADEKLADCGFSDFIALAKATATLLCKLHSHGIIHGDIKEKNFVLSKKDGTYVPYLIDFDSSYSVDDIPDWSCIGGSEGYQSPEILLYGASEGDVSSSTITKAADIFSLAVAWHKWWSGRMPAVDAEGYSLGAAVYLDKEIKLDNKFDKIIGSKHNATVMSLINWMLAKDASERPDALAVLDVLNDEKGVPGEYKRSSEKTKFDNFLWESHEKFAGLLSEEDLRAKGLTSFKRYNDGSGCQGLLYFLTREGEKKAEILNISEVIAQGFAEFTAAEFDKPWPEHQIELKDSEEIFSRGYWKIKRASNRRYAISNVNGRVVDKSWEWLLNEGLAKAIVYEVEADLPWPEHGRSYATANMARMGIKSISRVETLGEHRYRIVYCDKSSGKNKVNDNVSAKNIQIMGLIK